VKTGSGKNEKLPRKQSLAMFKVGDEVACTAKDKPSWFVKESTPH
jgi:hypothetical protein